MLLVFSSARQAVGGETLHVFRSSGHSFSVEINGDGSFRYEIPMLDDYGSGQWKINNRVLFEHGREKNWKIIKQ